MTQQANRSFQDFYPEISPYHSFYLSGDDIQDGHDHQIYVECCGNPKGIPVLFLHGGPGSGCRYYHRQYFDPAHYHIILFDQRGCGRSRPLASLIANTTQHLIADMEAIRQHLAIEQWLLFAGSWGSTLALSYTLSHSQHVAGLILRGVFLGRQHDIDWVYSPMGAARLFPQQWQQLMHILPPQQRLTPLTAFQHLLHADDPKIQRDTALALYHWQAAIGRLQQSDTDVSQLDEQQLLAHFQIQLHYALAQCFIADKPILDNIATLHAIPTWIVQGQYDLVCPTEQALALHQALPESELHVLHLAGHMGDEVEVIHTLVSLMDSLVSQYPDLANTTS